MGYGYGGGGGDDSEGEVIGTWTVPAQKVENKLRHRESSSSSSSSSPGAVGGDAMVDLVFAEIKPSPRLERFGSELADALQGNFTLSVHCTSSLGKGGICVSVCGYRSLSCSLFLSFSVSLSLCLSDGIADTCMRVYVCVCACGACLCA